MKPFTVLLVLACALSAAPIPKSLKTARADFTGKWELVEMRRAADVYKLGSTMYWIIDGDQLTFEERGVVNPNRSDTFNVIQQTDKEFQLDWTMLDKGKKIGSYLCVGTLDGDTLLINAGDSTRPLKAEVIADALFYTFKRVK